MNHLPNEEGIQIFHVDIIPDSRTNYGCHSRPQGIDKIVMNF